MSEEQQPLDVTSVEYLATEAQRAQEESEQAFDVWAELLKKLKAQNKTLEVEEIKDKKSPEAIRYLELQDIATKKFKEYFEAEKANIKK
jgi:cytochrome c-type biogenesis protein CcmH/NrfG